MKKRLVSLVLILCMIVSVFTLVSCHKKKGKGEETQETAATTDRWEILAPDVRAIDADDRVIKIECSNMVNSEKGSKNNLYLEGNDGDDKVTTIESMVRARNSRANELLGLSVEYVYWVYAYEKQWEPINTAIAGNDPEAPDVFVNMLYDMNNVVLNGGFKDVWSLPGSYFDFEADGWLTEWMANLSLTGDRAYLLGSDYFLDVFRSMSLLPFNVTLMNASASKLAPVILGEGESLGESEKLSYRFFDLVESGNWTWDVLGKLCAAVWVDKDSSGTSSIKDTLGIIADRYGGINTTSFIYSCGEQLTDVTTVRDQSSPYYRQQWIKYSTDGSKLNNIFDAVKSVFEKNGALSTSYTFSGDTEDKPGTTYHHKKFAKGELLFAGACLLGSLEDDVFQKDMTDMYSVVPFPKVDAKKEYNTVIINQGDVGAISVRTTPGKARAISAYLQYNTEHSAAIREYFLQSVTKYDTMDYDQGTDRMLDLIYESVRYGRDKAIDDVVCMESRDDRWHSLLKEQELCGGSTVISGSYKALQEKKQTKLDEIMAKWYTLPKS